jgi:type II secretory pathway predicted ATPase ExeA
MTKTRPRTDLYRSRFGLRHHPLPRDAAGPSFFDQTVGIKRLERYFQDLLDEPGLGVLTAAPGVGKTAAIRNLCASLPEPDFRVVYLCDTAVTACDLYRTLALELGLKPAHRRAQLWWDLKRTIAHLVEQQHTLPVLVIDEAQQLSDEFLGDLGGFLNFAFDRKTLLTLWLVGLPQLTVRLRMRHHAPLATRIVAHVQLEPLGREDFAALIAHGAKAAGAREKLLDETALELLWRASGGVPRVASRLLRAALGQAHDLNKNLVDEQAMVAAVDELTPPKETKP